MTIKQLRPLTLLLPVLLNACAGMGHKEPKQPDMFATNIKPNNEKVFNFSIDANEEKDSERPQRGGGGGGGNGGPPPDRNDSSDSAGGMPSEKLFDQLLDHLELKLSDTGYCREGYTKIDTYESSNRLHVLGRCNEPATPEDKRQFANNYGY
jgi:hypothetical protein